MSRIEKDRPRDPTPVKSGALVRPPEARRPDAPRRPADARVALDLREESDTPLQERPLEDDPREAEHQRRLEEERQAHRQAIELLQLKSSLSLKRQNMPGELLKTKAQAILAVGMGLLALGTLCYLLVRSDTPLELKKDILKYVGGAIGGVGIGYALGKQVPREADD